MNRKDALTHARKQYTQELSKEALVNRIYDDFDNRVCRTCVYWVKSDVTPTLMRCVADNHIGLVGETFYCANHKINKKAKS